VALNTINLSQPIILFRYAEKADEIFLLPLKINTFMIILFRYAEKADEIFSTAPEDPSSDFTTQM
jgi:hypothetical protein